MLISYNIGMKGLNINAQQKEQAIPAMASPGAP